MEKLSDNKLITRQDLVKILLDMIRPLKNYYNKDKSMLRIGNTAAHYGERSAQMEGWARVLWGLGPLFAGENSDLDGSMQKEIAQWLEIYKEGLINGTDPDSDGYWGDMADYDQKMVETAAVCVALSLAADVLWEPLPDEVKKRVHKWLGQINDHKVHANNWRFFRILTNMTFARLGIEVDEEALLGDYEVVESCYVSDGWYYDGHDGQMDYYIPFAMHFYGLIWAALAPYQPDVKSEKAAYYFGAEYRNRLLERGQRFAGDYETWFSDDGAEVPFGRSLTYRFAHSAFWSALIYAEDKLGGREQTGKYKHLLLSNLRSWMRYPINDAEGFLTIGYRYPNLFMSEKYNAPGSPYWSFKLFLVLALPKDSCLWKVQEEHISPPEKSFLKAPHMLLCHDIINGVDNVTMFPCGQHAGMEHGNCDSKYKKLVYSNRFGFSVQRGNGLEDGAFDNVFAVSRRGENVYHMTNCVEWQADKTMVRIVSRPVEGVCVATKVIPLGNGWHVRIHEIETAIPIDTVDGGFALPVEKPFEMKEGDCVESADKSGRFMIDGVNFIISGMGTVGVFTEDPVAEISFTRVFPNTNLMAPLTVIPYVKRNYEEGKYIQINAFYGAGTS